MLESMVCCVWKSAVVRRQRAIVASAIALGVQNFQSSRFVERWKLQASFRSDICNGQRARPAVQRCELLRRIDQDSSRSPRQRDSVQLGRAVFQCWQQQQLSRRGRCSSSERDTSTAAYSTAIPFERQRCLCGSSEWGCILLQCRREGRTR